MQQKFLLTRNTNQLYCDKIQTYPRVTMLFFKAYNKTTYVYVYNIYYPQALLGINII